MHDLDNNKEALWHKVGILAKFSTRVMHPKTTTMYFLQVNKEEEVGKESETTFSFYNFLMND